jgi:hypothetical protein
MEEEPEPTSSSVDLRGTLRAARPAPGRQFELQLRQHLSNLRARSQRPASLWPMVTLCVGVGMLLLLIAAASAHGGGLFG